LSDLDGREIAGCLIAFRALVTEIVRGIEDAREGRTIPLDDL
jgi:hypothetical protein